MVNIKNILVYVIPIVIAFSISSIDPKKPSTLAIDSVIMSADD